MAKGALQTEGASCRPLGLLEAEGFRLSPEFKQTNNKPTRSQHKLIPTLTFKLRYAHYCDGGGMQRY